MTTPYYSDDMTVQQLALRIPADPTDPHAEARAHVITAIATAAELDGGRVSANHVRDILAAVPEWDVPPTLVGATYRTLVLRGQLRHVGWETSTDVRGGNAGKPARVYEWVGAR